MIAVYPGTFDPPTLSHIEIIKRASKIFPKLVVAVAGDSTKKTLFTLEERVQMMQVAAENVEVVSFYGLLVDFAKTNGVSVIVRGLRALSDFEYEFKMAYMNKKLNNDIETVFIPATEKENFISSSFVREIARLGGDVTHLVPPHIKKKLDQRFVKC
jgi:pantetheine-phosphate adenylyltransferase